MVSVTLNPGFVMVSRSVLVVVMFFIRVTVTGDGIAQYSEEVTVFVVVTFFTWVTVTGGGTAQYSDNVTVLVEVKVIVPGRGAPYVGGGASYVGGDAEYTGGAAS